MLDKAILDRSFELTLFSRFPHGWEGLEAAFLGAGHTMKPSAQGIGKRMPIVGHVCKRRHIIVSAGDMGLVSSSLRRPDVYEVAHRVGLRECWHQAGWELMVAIANKTLSLSIPVRDLLIGAVPIKTAPECALTLEIRVREIQDGKGVVHRSYSMDVDTGEPGVLCFTKERYWLFEVVE